MHSPHSDDNYQKIIAIIIKKKKKNHDDYDAWSKLEKIIFHKGLT